MSAPLAPRGRFLATAIAGVEWPHSAGREDTAPWVDANPVVTPGCLAGTHYFVASPSGR